MKSIKYIVILAVSAFIFNSCTKQVAGPAGPTGPQGPQGSAASYAVTIDSIPASAWGGPNINGYYTATINNIKALSTPTYSIVEVYFSTSFNSLSTWHELPAANVFAANDAFDFYYRSYSVTIEYGPSAPASPWLYFKVVVINQP